MDLARRFVFLLCTSIFCSSLGAQSSSDYHDKEFLIKFWDDVPAEDQEACINSHFHSCYIGEKTYFGYRLIQAPTEALAEQMILSARRDSHFSSVIPNYMLETRSKNIRRPNDPELSRQWYLQRINAFEAWDITTGGPALDGAYPVCALYEVGFERNHPDLADQSLYKNTKEIPDNGIDDDSNGYVDDYEGYNVLLENDDHLDDTKKDNDHGNAILGIIGASSDNNTDIAGLLWDAQMMMITGRRATIGTWIQGMDYIYHQRKLYNQTNGQQGAFVVAYNMSFGLKPNSMEDERLDLLCPIFDSLGSVGIISVGATTNEQNYNVDTVNFRFSGDIPSNCSSRHLIVAANSDFENNIIGGFGERSVDLAAPAEDIVLLAQEGVLVDGGTSFAAPQVVAAIGMIYATLDPSILQLAKTSPDIVNEVVIELILTNTRPVNNFQGKLKTEGILDLKNILDATMGITSVDRGLTASESSLYDIVQSGRTLVFSPKDHLTHLSDHPIAIYDILGTAHYIGKISPSTGLQVNLNTLPAGAYILSLHGEKKERQVARFILH